MRYTLSDLPSVDTPDVGGLADELIDLAATAADAVSSAAGQVPGLDDYRALARRRRRTRILSAIGAAALVALVVMILRRQSDDDVTG